jgi:hypothetical protein
MEPKRSMGAGSLTVCGLSVAGALFGLGDQHAWIALVASSVLFAMLVVLAMAFNVRIEIDERMQYGHRHRELRVTRRQRRRRSSRRPAPQIEPTPRRRPCWLRSRARR